MRGWPALLTVAILTLTVPLLLVGCKGQATQTSTKAASAEAGEGEAEGHDHEGEAEGHDHEGEAPGEPEHVHGSTGEAPAILADLQSGNDTKTLFALTKASALESESDREELRDAIRALALSKDSSAEVREAAVTAWRPWAGKDPTPILKAVDSPHSTVRQAAAAALADVQGPLAMEALKKLRNDPDSAVKAAAADLMAQRLRAEKSDNSIDLLIADLGRPDGDRSARAGMQLEQRGRTDRRVVTKLAHALRTSPSPARRHSCAIILALVCAGTNPGQQRFASAARATYRLADEQTPAYEEGVEPLVAALRDDPEPMVRESAAFGLGMIGSAKAAKPLGRALSDPDRDVRRRAAAALVTVPPAEARDQLVRAARNDPSPAVRRFAVEAMANLAPAEAGWAVAGCLRDRDPYVRMYACSVLQKVGTRSQTEALLMLFDDPDEDVRWKAVEAVANFADPSARDALIAALNDPSARVALAAERGVHRLGIGTRVLTKDERMGARRK